MDGWMRVDAGADHRYELVDGMRFRNHGQIAGPDGQLRAEFKVAAARKEMGDIHLLWLSQERIAAGCVVGPGVAIIAAANRVYEITSESDQIRIPPPEIDRHWRNCQSLFDSRALY